MPSRLVHLVRRCSPVAASWRLSRHLATQVTISAMATLCVAAISHSGGRPPAETDRSGPAVTLDAAAVVGLLKNSFGPDGFHDRFLVPIGSGPAPGPTTTASFARFASSDWMTLNTPVTPGIQTASLESPSSSPALIRKPIRVAAAPLPPVRHAVLDASDPRTIATPAPAPSETRRASLLGFALPGFVPSGDDIVRTVTALTGQVADVMPKI